MTKIQDIERKIQKLPPSTMAELDSFLDKLLKKGERKGTGKLKQDWAGALKEFKTEFTSLELQKKALDWRVK
jgi:Protein of unknown function (DUF2281)